MEKTQMTMKSFNSWRKTFACGYCDLQYIMHGKRAPYYNAGVYGWNCDIFVDYSREIAISTGYRNMRGTWIPDSFISKFDKKARQIIENKNGKYNNWDECQKALDKNREAFFAALEKAEF